MAFESTFTADNWHRDAKSIAQRNAIRTRRWGMRATVYLGADAGDYVLSYNQASTNLQDNNNWLKVADIGDTWGGGGGAVTASQGLTAIGNNVQMSGPFTMGIDITSTNNSRFLVSSAAGDFRSTIFFDAQSFSISTIDVGTGNEASILLDPITGNGSLNAENINLFSDANTNIDAFGQLSMTSQADVILEAATNLDLAFTTVTLNGDAGAAGEFFAADGTWQTPGGGGATANNGLTETAGNIQLGGALVQDTFIPSGATPRFFSIGQTSAFGLEPVNGFTVVSNAGVTFYSNGVVLNGSNFNMAANGVFLTENVGTATNNTGTNMREMRVNTTGVVAAGFGGREQVQVEITAGTGAAITNEYKALSVAGTGQFQWNICNGTAAVTINATDVVQSFFTPQRNVAFFTNDSGFATGEAVIKIANATTAPNALVANSIMVWAQDSSDATSTLALFTEQTVQVIGATTATNKIKVRINGTEYYLLLSTI